MNKKLIISETQYEKLRFFILETSFDKLAKNVIKDGDTIKINANNEILSFKVIDSITGQVYMENIDKGTPYFGKLVFISFTSFNDSKLDLRVANDTQKTEKPINSSNWAKLTLKNIEKIDVYRGDNLIDSTSDTKTQEPEEKKDDAEQNLSDEAIDNINDLMRLMLDGLDDGKGLTLVMSNNEQVKLCCQSASNGTFVLETIGESSIELLSKFDSITIKIIPVDDEDVDTDLLTANKELWSTTDNGKTVNIVVEGHSGDKTEKVKITGVSDLKIDQSCSSEEDEEGKDEGELDAKKIHDIITGDAELRAAFYKRPSFWRSFKAEILGTKPTTTGYVVVKDLVDRYMDDKAAEKLGKNFLRKADIVFRPLEKIVIRYTENGKNQAFVLNVNDEIEDVRYIRSQPSEGSNYNILLRNKDIDILVKEKSDRQNVYVCDVIKKYKETVNGKEVTKYSEPVKNISIEFIDSPGYRVDKEQKK
jgi:hypothetical protein